MAGVITVLVVVVVVVLVLLLLLLLVLLRARAGERGTGEAAREPWGEGVVGCTACNAQEREGWYGASGQGEGRIRLSGKGRTRTPASADGACRHTAAGRPGHGMLACDWPVALR